MKLIFNVFILSILFVYINPNDVLACSCLPSKPSFCESVDTTNYIVEVVVTSKPQTYSLEVSILDNIALNIADDTIFILGQDGFNCGADMNLFDVGDTLILGLNNSTMVDIQNHQIYNWFLSGCDIYYLKVENGLVKGQIKEGVVSESISDFKNSIIECVAISTEINETNRVDVQLFPNPVKDILYLNSSQIFENSLIEIYNSNGIKVLSTKWNSENNQINLRGLISGLYFLRLYSNDEAQTLQIIKE